MSEVSSRGNACHTTPSRRDPYVTHIYMLHHGISLPLFTCLYRRRSDAAAALSNGRRVADNDVGCCRRVFCSIGTSTFYHVYPPTTDVLSVAQWWPAFNKCSVKKEKALTVQKNRRIGPRSTAQNGQQDEKQSHKT